MLYLLDPSIKYVYTTNSMHQNIYIEDGTDMEQWAEQACDGCAHDWEAQEVVDRPTPNGGGFPPSGIIADTVGSTAGSTSVREALTEASREPSREAFRAASRESSREPSRDPLTAPGHMTWMGEDQL
jgi:hypothetical protein